METGALAPVAVISGGSSGIGLAIARELAARGYRLHLIARDRGRLEAAIQALPGAAVVPHTLDVADDVAANATIEAVMQHAGRIDWLIASAGIAEPSLFLEESFRSARRHMEVNYFGTLNLVRPVARIMKAQGGGRITLISSAIAFGGIVGYAAYAPSKFAVRGLGEVLEGELSQFGIDVSVAYPPDTDTPQLAHEAALRPEATRRLAAGGGLLSAEEVARDIVEGALKGRFVLAPGLLMRSFALFHSLIAPILRRRQRRIVAAVGKKKRSGGE